MFRNFNRLIATFFFIGYLPLAPGSAASLAGVMLAIIFYDNTFVYGTFFLLVTILGFLTTGDVEKTLNKKDPGCIVIDEVSGVMIAFWMLPLTVPVVITAFFVFRAFDMFKIYPANKFESMNGGVGIMMDDIVAGLYTNVIMHLALILQG